MATSTIGLRTAHNDRQGRHRAAAALFVLGGLLMVAGGQLHPQGSGHTVDEYLLTMFSSPQWLSSHLVLLAGSATSCLAFIAAWRSEAFRGRVQRWLPLVAVAWGLGAVEMLPHLLAANDAHALEHHEATPVLDLHVLMQLVASPAVGVTSAFIAVAVAVAAKTRPAQVLAGFAVLGGLGSAAASPLVTATGDPRFALLFPLQTGLAVWLVGTGVRLWRR
jgi:cytochrome bd-type quinol oxidase subunit 2